jgi:hypothetical protein
MPERYYAARYTFTPMDSFVDNAPRAVGGLVLLGLLLSLAGAGLQASGTLPAHIQAEQGAAEGRGGQGQWKRQEEAAPEWEWQMQQQATVDRYGLEEEAEFSSLEREAEGSEPEVSPDEEQEQPDTQPVTRT